ncbi:MAG: DEAD/DEAH box helicase [Deltaproteobacteria bacterium]|nr:DEAD/DEAH box helicase [Deltaproteobacteria bacterium]
MKKHQLDPLVVSRRIREDYERYIETAFPMRNGPLRRQFRELLQRQDFLVRGPYLEATPPFKSGRNIRELASDGVLSHNFIALDGPGFPNYGYPIDRRLYQHQDRAITKVRNGRNVVVATGTGSGKTESFLLPIIDHLLRECETGTIKAPGVRALLLYPMNALANDQLKRLRRLLQKMPEVSFGRYTGQTQEHQDTAEQDFRHVFPHEPRIENELISRDEIRDHPPHILLTNYAMLEYLLLRPKDTPLFDGILSGSWAFVVVDEAHSYSGAAGMEVGMLLRRLKDRVVKSRQGALRCIATSATLGGGRADFPRVADFATALFGEMFEWEEQDKDRQDIVEPSIQADSHSCEPWGEPDPALYQAFQDHLENLQAMAEIAREHNVPDEVVDQAVKQAGGTSDCFLYWILHGDKRVQCLKTILRSKPASLESAAAEVGVFGKESAGSLLALVGLISLCVQAKPEADSAPLISARYHLFCRALEGAFVTFPACEEPVLHLEPVDRTEEQGVPCQAFEIATCTRCGHTALAGTLETDHLREDGTVASGPCLRPLRPSENERPGEKSFFSWDVPPDSEVDEDEAALSDAEPDLLVSNPGTICAACGAFTRGMTEPVCTCDSKRHIVVYEAPLRDGRLATCPACGAQTPYEDIVHRFYTGKDAPVAVLASSLYQHVPPDSTSSRPGGSRKLLIFSDSRQDAAYFAPYLETTHQGLLQRSIIVKALTLHGERFGREPARPIGLADTLLLELSRNLNIFPSPGDAAREQKERCSWVFQELLALDRRFGLEGTALLKVGYTKPSEWRPPHSLMRSPWSLSEYDAWSLVEVLLDTLRFSGCLCVEPADITSREFEPRNRLVYCRETGGSNTRGVTLLGWVPQRDLRVHVTNRRFDYLRRLLAKWKDLKKRL